MKKPKKKQIYLWLLAAYLTGLAALTFLHSDPHEFCVHTAALKSITFEGTDFMVGVILSPLIRGE